MTEEIRNLDGDSIYTFVEAFKMGRKAANKMWENKND